MPASTVVTIEVGSRNWETRAKAAIGRKKQVQLVVRGPQAALAGTQLQRQTNNAAGVTFATGVEELIALVVIVGIAALVAICLYGMSKGYKIKVVHIVHNKAIIFDDELRATLVPPSR